MALFRKATYVGPVPNENTGEMVRPLLGLVLHVEQGSETSADNWFHNPKAQASAHFGNPQTGPLQQFVDTADKAWAEVAGNSRWISVEHEGFSGETPAPTASQIENDAQLLAWLHVTEGVQFKISDDPNSPGLGWHGMGGAAWGGHYACPGPRILDARKQIIGRAKQIAGVKPKPILFGVLRPGTSGPKVRALQTALNGNGNALRPDGDFGPQTAAAVTAFKKVHGWTPNPIAGRRVQKALGLLKGRS